MAIESATYISELVATNPVTMDQRSTADDHLRLIKSVTKASFPSVTNAVTATHTELSLLSGVTGIRTSVNDAFAFKASDTTRTSTISLTVDPELSMTLTGPGGGISRKYGIQAFIRVQQNNNAPGFSFTFQIGGEESTSNPLVGYCASTGISVNGSSAIDGVISGVDIADIAQAASGGNGYAIMISGVVKVQAASRTLGFFWSQRVATASNTTVSEGSWMRVTRLS